MKKSTSICKVSLAVAVVLLLISCIEPFSTTFIDFESALVIQATITNEMKPQRILLSRTYKFEDDGPEGESGARVEVSGSDGSRYNFEEVDKGTYLSISDFAAKQEVDYTLSITTQDGRSYASTSASLGGSNGIDSLYAERMVTDLGEEGIGIRVNTYDSTNSSKYYRYEYEETYKIIAPRYRPTDIDYESFIFTFHPRPIEERVCYTTDFSNRIVLANTSDLGEDRLSGFMVRFVNRDNYIISHRYSILMRQYVQSFDSYNFYETLNNFSSTESLFSETQPGFLEGNIVSTEDTTEKVLGYFDVSAVDEKRIFFDYEDFFPGEPLPPYADPCNLSAPPPDKLVNQILLNIIKYYDENPIPEPTTGPYFIVPRVCGDCTVLGTPEVPDFWIE